MPADDPSSAFIDGPPLRVKTGGALLKFPTARHIVAAWRATNAASIQEFNPARQDGRAGKVYHVMHRLFLSEPTPVDRDTAGLLVQMLVLRSVDDVSAALRRAKVMESAEGAPGAMNVSKFKAFFRELTAVITKNGSMPSCLCEVFCKEGMCPNILGVLEIQRGLSTSGGRSILGIPLPLGSSGRSGTPPPRHVEQRAQETQAQANARGDVRSAARQASAGHACANLNPARSTCKDGRNTTNLTLSIPETFDDDMRALFAPSDSVGAEAMACLFGKTGDFGITEYAFTSQVGGATWCVTTPDGLMQLAAFLEKHPQLVFRGWCHSHHALGITPSTHDLRTQWKLQAYFGNGAPLVMLIINHTDGVRAWTMTASQLEALRRSEGQTDGSRPATDFLQDVNAVRSPAPGAVHALGAWSHSFDNTPSDEPPSDELHGELRATAAKQPATKRASAKPVPQIASIDAENRSRLFAWLQSHAAAQGTRIIRFADVFEALPLPLGATNIKAAKQDWMSALHVLRAEGALQLVCPKKLDMQTWTAELL